MNRILSFVCLIFFLSSCQEPQQVDLIISNGTIFTGEEEDSFMGDIAIIGDSIVFVGPNSQGRWIADTIIDATGFTVCPGFIDPHTHARSDLRSNKRNRNANLNFLTQGVTTVVIGNDGGGPVRIKSEVELYQQQGVGTNVAILVGHGSLRRLVMGVDNRPPTEEELNNMKTAIDRGMKDGAVGMSAGLYYTPGNFSKTEEVIELAKVVAANGGYYDVHMRDESTYTVGLQSAVRETVEIAEKADITANISHIKALGVDVWGQSEPVIAIVDSARQTGLRVTADQYPYQASSTSLTAVLVPKWVMADDPDFTKKLNDPALSNRIRTEMAENMRKRGGPGSLLLTVPYADSIKGLTLAEVARKWGKDPIDAAIHVLNNGSSSVGSFNMKETDIQNFMRQPWVMTGSDGSAGHPRKYGSFPKKMKEYVFEKEIISLADMIRRSSGLAAETFNFYRRGKLKTGYKADIIIFKPEEVKDNATFENPTALSEGMQYVIVNGQIAINQGEYTGKLAGEVVKRGGGGSE